MAKLVKILLPGPIFVLGIVVAKSGCNFGKTLNNFSKQLH